MRYDSIRGKGFIPFPEEFYVDIAALPGPLVALCGINGSGKCLPARARVYVPGAGAVPIDEFVRRQIGVVVGYAGGKVGSVAVSGWHELGTKRVLRITARGWSHDVAATHPVLTARGWVRAEELVEDDHLAVARRLPMHISRSPWSDDEVRLGGYLIADGCLGDGTKVSLCASLEWKVEEYQRCLRSVFVGAKTSALGGSVDLLRGSPEEELNLRLAAAVAAAGGTIWDYLGQNTPRFLKGLAQLDQSTLTRLREDGVAIPDPAHYDGSHALDRWTSANGLSGKAPHKTLGAFQDVTDAQVPVLLGALWFADGYVSANCSEVSYSTASILLAQQVRELLLRIGVLSACHTKHVDGRPYYNVVIVANCKSRFADALQVRGPKGERLRGAVTTPDGATNADTLPFTLWSRHELTGKVSAWRTAKSGMSRTKFLELGGPAELAREDVWWVPVDAIEDLGVEPCFDITVDTTEHAYVADGLIVHNSSFLELLKAATTPGRKCPTRGSISDLATARDAFIEVGVTNGAAHRIRHTVDSITSKGTSVVLDEAGVPRYGSDKVRSFDDWARKHLPPPEVVETSTFCAQKSGGFIEMSEGERIACLLRVLQVERLEALAEGAREHARAAKTATATATARLADERARAGDAAAIEVEVAELRQRRADVAAELTQAQSALAEARSEEERVRAAYREAEAAKSRRSDLSVRIEKATREKADIEQRIANNEGVIGRAAQIVEARIKAAALDSRLSELSLAVTSGGANVAALKSELAAAERAHEAAAADERRLNDRVETAQKKLADRESVAVATAAVTALAEAVDAAERDVALIDTHIRELGSHALLSATTRIGSLRTALDDIANEEPEAPAAYARCALEADDEDVQLASEAPALIATQRSALAEGQSALAAARAKLRDAERLAARAQEIANAEVDFVAASSELEAASSARAEAAVAVAGLQGDLALATSAHEAQLVAQAVAWSERDALAPILKLVEPLAHAEVRVAELRPLVVAAATTIATLSAERDAIVVPVELPQLPDVAAASRRVQDLTADATSIERDLAVHEAKLDTAKSSSVRLTALEAEQRAADEDLADWLRLAEDLGKDGLQSAEVDAAGPELTEMANDLLHTCVGPRWTVSIEARRLSADGKQVLDGCEVRVIDSEKGRDSTVETLSGGEGVIVGEAINLALAMIACRKSGVEGPTLIRDETGAALDPVNGRAYVAMLRRAGEIVGASKVIYVTHAADLADLADSRIDICDGKVTAVSS